MNPNDDRRGPWQVLGSRQVYENDWIRVREDDVIRPDGRPGIYGVVEFQGLAVAIVALTDDEQVYLVGQYRYPTDTYSWEVVEGTSEAGEEPLAAAKRELSEETGLTATEWLDLGCCQFSNSSTDQVGYLYLARGLTAGEPHPDETEELAVKVVPLAEAVAMSLSSEIDDAFSIIGLLRAWNYLESNRQQATGNKEV